MGLGLEADVAASIDSFRFNEAGLRHLLTGEDGPVFQDLSRRAIRVEGQAKVNATRRPGPEVRSGRLRGSITHRLGRDAQGPYADIGSNVEYACIFNGHTRITTDRGMRALCQLRVGERVLTQAGDFHRVLAKTAFPAVEKPELIDFVVPWRSDRDHRLTLTLDHKVLCYREGRNQWIMAGDLRDGDCLFDRIKISHAKGTRRVKTCEWCKRQHQRQGRRYCSLPCRDAAWAAGANPHLGAVRSDATKAKLRAGCIQRRSGLTLNRRLGEKGFRTSHEREVEGWLQERGVEYECQVAVGGHVVDFFLPESREVIEADGAYWHQDQGRDIERDRELLAVLPGIEITHLHFFDKRFTPPLDAEPLPGVRYVACNPGPGSFVDPAQFQMRPVRIERIWNYVDEPVRPKGGRRALLYDLAIEGVHSFLAGGLIVSNSYLEFGTRRMPPYPFLRPALSVA